MKKFLPALLILVTINQKLHSQYADAGTGNLKNSIWWFDWNNFNVANGASKTTTTADGLTVTITFSNVQGPVLTPSIMNTWYGAVLHYLYDFNDPNIKPALYSPYTTQNSQFTITITATRNGLPTGFKFIAADAEASALSEITTLTSSGSNWQCVDFFRNSSQNSNPFLGCNTTTAVITDTYGNSAGIGQNPVIATNASVSGSLTINCLFDRSGIEGQMGIAFGIFSSIDRGDLPGSYGYASHVLTYSNSNPCNYLPPYPTLIQSESLKIGNIKGDPDPTESTDDNASGVDEDGVISFPAYTNSGTYSIPVTLNNTTGGNAYLTGWFDFNRNGVFDNNESVTNTIPNNTTSSILTWTGLPSTLPNGSINNWAFRFRLSTNLNSTKNATGFSPDGEVEDYITSNLQITTPDFIIPDTVCVNSPVNIVNTSKNATTSFWNFCVANINSTPDAVNLGNIGGQFGLPVFIDYIQYNGDYYGFLTNNFPGKLTRLDFGNSLLNTPTAVDLGNVGVIPNGAEGIQMAFNEGRWYAIIVGGNSTTGGSRIVKIDFGPNLTNTSPVGTNWGNIGGMEYPGDLHLFNDNNNWYAFTVDQNSAVTRFSFGSSFVNPPTAMNFGNVGGSINWGDGIYIINDNGQWHGFVCSRNNSSITRLDFGNSLLNTPVGVNLGNPGNTLNLPRDIYITKFCNQLVGFVVNEGSNDLIKLSFADLTSIPTAISLGNVGNLAFPHSISKFFRVGSDLYSFIPNVNNNTLTRINFKGCTNSSIPNYLGTTPPAVTYTTPGTYNINLTIDDGLPTQASICKQIVVIDGPDIDFNYIINACSPLSIQFNGYGNNIQNPVWNFGDAITISGNLTPVHIYATNKPYTISFTADFNGCFKTITKTIDFSLLKDDIILTKDTTVCFGNTKKLLTVPSFNFCWNPVTYLDDPASQTPVSSPKQNITYYYTAEIKGNNLVNNGDFSQGNIGFTSEYIYGNPNITEGQYFVGSNPQLWNPSLSPCTDHTNSSGNMLLVNGSPVDNINVWKQTITVTPNTNYAYSVWIQSLWVPNPAQLEFSINGKHTGTLITASLPTCSWKQFYTTWNSGNNTSATLTIINKNTFVQGNDFALDDISFAPFYIKRDSVKIIVDTPFVKTSNDAASCEGINVQLNTTGVATYSWSPSSGLSNPNIANPLASPNASTQYIVTGTSINGCIAKDTVNITIYPKPIINITANDTICKNTSLQLLVSGGNIYSWSPPTTLSNSMIANPVASPVTTTTYYATVTSANLCSNMDSVQISIYPDPLFTISPPANICEKESIELKAGGGDIYSWQSDQTLSGLDIPNPLATPLQTTAYTVTIKDSKCNNTASLTTQVTVKSLPTVIASKSNDIDCSNDRSQLNSSGASSYSWTPVNSLNNSNIANPIATPQSETKYTVKGTDINGCSNYDTVTVKFLSGNNGNYLMPNAFTPNNDGVNDCYGIKYWGVIKELEFSIYNRWGQRIFYTKNPNDCWDGTYKGVMQNLGIYIYVINAKTFCGDTYQKGTLTLIR